MFLYGFPTYENHVILSGWSPEPEEDFATGFRFGGMAAMGYDLGGSPSLPDIGMKSSTSTPAIRRHMIWRSTTTARMWRCGIFSEKDQRRQPWSHGGY